MAGDTPVITATFEAWREQLKLDMGLSGLSGWDDDILTETSIDVAATMLTEVGYSMDEGNRDERFADLQALVQSLVAIIQVSTGIVQSGENLNS